MTVAERPCGFCGTLFAVSRERRKYCGDVCRRALEAAKARAWYRANLAADPDRRREKYSKWRSSPEHRDVDRQKQRARLQADPETVRAYARDRVKRFRARHAEKLSEAARKYQARRKELRDQDPERFRAYVRKCQQANPEKRREGVRRRRVRMAGVEGDHTAAEFLALCDASAWQCAYCNAALDQSTVTEDHVVPISRGGSDFIANVALACKSCNSAKGTRTAEEFGTRVLHHNQEK